MTKIFNNILINGEMPEEWRRSTITPIYKGNSNHMNCVSYRGIKLLNHTIKLWERILESRIREKVEVAENQFGFQPGKSMIDPIFTIKLVMEECREKQQELHLIFIYLEKAYDTIIMLCDSF